MRIPQDRDKLRDKAKEYIDICSVSMGARASQYDQWTQYIDQGNVGDDRSLSNLLYAHNDRLASHLFCPTGARFTLDFKFPHPEVVLNQAKEVARMLTRDFNEHNHDLMFGLAVKGALDYGASIIKSGGTAATTEIGGKQINHLKDCYSRLVQPWFFGVDNEGKNNLDDQDALMETVFLSKDEAWRLICQHRWDERYQLYRRVLSHATKNQGPQFPTSFVRLLSSNPLNLTGTNQQVPGGIVQTSGSSAYVNLGPQILQQMVAMREMWMWDDDREDYLMVQIIDPDIVISPGPYRNYENAFCRGHHPFNLVQPNITPGYFWGRSEIVDLIPIQEALTETKVDMKNIIGVQYRKRYAFLGFDGDGQDLYDAMQSDGWVSGRQGTDVKDLTPQLPAGALEYIKQLHEDFENVGGFGNILSGQGEAGVRAGNHAATLVKTASPRLRDRSLIVERQYAQFADTWLHYLEAKDAVQYHTDAERPAETSFVLAQIPSDRRVSVDSHSSSPIYENDHNQLAAFGLKSGIVEGDDAIEMLNYPNSDNLVRKWRKKAAAQAKLVEEHPELAFPRRSSTRR